LTPWAVFPQVAVKGDLHESVECIPQSMGKGGSRAPASL
jgi:hypothetical protein